MNILPILVLVGCRSFDAIGAFKLVKNIPELIEGDILIDSNKDFRYEDRVGIYDDKKTRWPNGIIPYDLNETGYNAYHLSIIQEAFEEIEDYTCIKFVPRKNEKDFIYITPKSGCNSFVGRKGGMQRISLITPDCIDKGTIIHELMHTLGFWHEHNRGDRDDYIEVLWENVINEKKINFIKYSLEEFNYLKYPYDYKSVLHYSAYAFSKQSRLSTMRAKDSDIRLKDLGRAYIIGTLTTTDIKKINDLYECAMK